MSDIEAHTELTVAYVEPLLPRDKRQSRLYALHGFVCRCDACTAPDVELSDARRAFIASHLPTALDGDLGRDDLQYLAHAMRSESYLFGIEDVERLLAGEDGDSVAQARALSWPAVTASPPTSHYASQALTYSDAPQYASAFDGPGYPSSFDSPLSPSAFSSRDPFSAREQSMTSYSSYAADAYGDGYASAYPTSSYATPATMGSFWASEGAPAPDTAAGYPWSYGGPRHL